MMRLTSLMAWFFTSLGIAMLAISILVVPSNAFAFDPGDDCAQVCGTDPECGKKCCESECAKSGGGQSCMNDCCKAICENDADCLEECSGEKEVDCRKCEKMKMCFKQFGFCDNLNLYCNEGPECKVCFCRKHPVLPGVCECQK